MRVTYSMLRRGKPTTLMYAVNGSVKRTGCSLSFRYFPAVKFPKRTPVLLTSGGPGQPRGYRTEEKAFEAAVDRLAREIAKYPTKKA